MKKQSRINHLTTLYAKVGDQITYDNLDQEVVKLAKRAYRDFKTNEIMTPQNLLIFQIVAEGCAPNTYALEKENGMLFEGLWFSSNLDSIRHSREIETEFPGDHTKTTFQSGYLYKNAIGDYNIFPFSSKKDIGFGFCLEIWNNRQFYIGKEHCDNMMGGVTKLIKQNYSEFVEILKQKSQ